MSRYDVKASKDVHIRFSIRPFPSNCGYRVMCDDSKVTRGYDRLPREEQKYVNRVVFACLCNTHLSDIRKVILTDYVKKDCWLYNFMVDNDLLVGTKVSGNHGRYKTISAEFDPYDTKKLPIPKRPNGFKKISPDFVTNIRVNMYNGW